MLAAVVGLWLTYVGHGRAHRGCCVESSPTTRPSPVVVAAGRARHRCRAARADRPHAAVVVTTSRSAAGAADSVPSGCNGSEELCDLPARRGDLRRHAQLDALAAVPGLAVRRADRPDRRPAERRHQGAPLRHALRHPVAVADARVADADRAHRSRPRAGQPVVRAGRPRRRRAGQHAGRAGTAGGRRRQRDLPLPQLLRARRGLVRHRAGGHQAVRRHPSRRRHHHRHPGRHDAGRHGAGVHRRRAGGPHIATLELGEPLPDAAGAHRRRDNLVVFAEAAAAGAPPWYQPAYQGWIQETQFEFDVGRRLRLQPEPWRHRRASCSSSTTG